MRETTKIVNNKLSLSQKQHANSESFNSDRSGGGSYRTPCVLKKTHILFYEESQFYILHRLGVFITRSVKV